VDASSAQSQRASARIGAVLRGKYVLDRVLGIGGMATVYAATHRNAKRFAVKMLHPELSLDEDVRTRFLREGYVANKIDHPGAVDVLDDDTTEDGSAFLVMELLEGCTVEQMANAVGGRISLEAALAMAHQLLDILAAAHDKTIVHRDVKPANLFVLRDGTLKVLDFGIARLRDAASASALTTGTGAVLGTPAFMAPEQALSSSEVDGRTDLYAVGATVFMLVSGAPVHEGGNTQEMIVRAATRQARSLATVAPAAPAAVVSVIDKALAFEKTDRWETAASMRTAIEIACKESFDATPAPETLAALVKRATGPAARAAQSQATVLEPIAITPAPATFGDGAMATADTATKAKELRESAQKLLALDYFSVLGVGRGASPDDVKKAFLEAAKAWHPDRVPPGLEEVRPLFGKVFARLELARATVSDPQRRARYIEELAKPAGAAASASEMAAAEAKLEFQKAEALLKKNDAVQAEVHLRRAVHLAPGNAEFQVLLVWLQAKPDSTIGRLRELVTDLDRLVDRVPQSERVYFYRAQLKKRLDLTKEAMADFARAADLNPNNVEAIREVRLHKMRQEKASPAAKESESALGFFRKLFKR